MAGKAEAGVHPSVTPHLPQAGPGRWSLPRCGGAAAAMSPGCHPVPWLLPPRTLGPVKETFYQHIGAVPNISCSLQLFHIPSNVSVKESAEKGSPRLTSFISPLWQSSALSFSRFLPHGMH